MVKEVNAKPRAVKIAKPQAAERYWNSTPTTCSAWLVSAVRRSELSPYRDVVDAANDVPSGSDIRSDVTYRDPAPECSWRACSLVIQRCPTTVPVTARTCPDSNFPSPVAARTRLRLSRRHRAWGNPGRRAQPESEEKPTQRPCRLVAGPLRAQLDCAPERPLRTVNVLRFAGPSSE
jgi:hypothetical protein